MNRITDKMLDSICSAVNSRLIVRQYEVSHRNGYTAIDYYEVGTQDETTGARHNLRSGLTNKEAYFILDAIYSTIYAEQGDF